ncbi:MAG: VTC domain-containing protein [Candidatus Omnitrophica bacterium]|nr:VTC domain-containing protein [Candidatus Omnitrophota bacterium]
MADFPDNGSDYRYERKYVVAKLTVPEVESLIKTHPACFYEIFHARVVSNIYLDSFGLKSYSDRVNGASSSTKVRIRWYENLFGYIAKPVLELKIKRGPLGRKESFPLRGFLLDNDLKFDVVKDVLLNSNMPDALKSCLSGMEFSIMNSFKRKYFQSADRKFRLTVDSDIKYYELQNNCNLFLNIVSEPGITVVEIKYGRKDDDCAIEITNFLPFRMSRNSKYVNALEKLNLWC